MNKAETEVERSSDLTLLRSTIDGLVGKKCWRAAFTYGDELTLHFGRKVQYGLPAMAGKQKGEWRLGTRGTAWKLFTPNGLISSAKGAQTALESQVKVLEGRQVTNVSVSIPDNVLTVAFGNDYLFRVLPSAADDKVDLPYWELFMPNHKLVSFGPGDSWWCQPSDQSERRTATS